MIPLSLDRRRPSSQARTPTMVVMMPKTMATAVSFDTDVIVVGWNLLADDPLVWRYLDWVQLYTREKGGHVESYKFHDSIALRWVVPDAEARRSHFVPLA